MFPCEDDVTTTSPDTQIEGSGEPVDDKDLLDLLVDELEGSIPSWEARTVRNMFSSQAKQIGTMPTIEPWAWLDDRECSSTRARASLRVRSCLELREILRQKASQLRPVVHFAHYLFL
jgi:hypothetical protein